MPPEGADAVLAALPASEADMPATKDFVRAEIRDLRVEMTEQFANASTETYDKIGNVRDVIGDLRNEMTTGFSSTDTKIGDLRVEMTDKINAVSTDMKRWFIGTGIALAGVVVAAINTLPN